MKIVKEELIQDIQSPNIIINNEKLIGVVAPVSAIVDDAMDDMID